MKKVLLIAILCISNIICAQVLDSTAIVTVSSNSKLYDRIDSSCNLYETYDAKYTGSDLLYLTEIFDCKKYSTDIKVGKVYFDSKIKYVDIANDQIFFINDKQVDLGKIESTLDNKSVDEKLVLETAALNNSVLYIDYIKRKYLKEFFEYEKYGIGIIKARPVEQSIYTGADFKIFNFSKKTIKYITFNFYGKNAVNDKVGVTLSRKGIGPVESISTGAWSFESVWLTDIIDSMKLISMNVIYMDGTTKVFQATDKIWIGEDLYEKLNVFLEE